MFAIDIVCYCLFSLGCCCRTIYFISFNSSVLQVFFCFMLVTISMFDFVEFGVLVMCLPLFGWIVWLVDNVRLDVCCCVCDSLLR